MGFEVDQKKSTNKNGKIKEVEEKVVEKPEENEGVSISYFRLVSTLYIWHFVALEPYLVFKYATTLDKICMAAGALFAAISGVIQPFLMEYFGEVTGYIVTYASKYDKDMWPEEKDEIRADLEYGVWKFAVESCVSGVVVIITTYLSSVLFSYSAVRQIYKIRKEFLQKTLNQDVEWFDMNRTGDFATTFTQNISKIEEGIGDKIGVFIFFQSTFVTGVIMGIVKGWKLALVCMISLPLSTTIMMIISWVSTKFSAQEMEAYGAAGSIAEEVLSSIKTVVAFDGMEKETTRYNKQLINAKKNNIKRGFFNALSNCCLWFFVYACYALSFWYGVTLILEERHLPVEEQIYTPGNMVTVFFATLIATWNFGQAAPLLETFGAAKGAGQKIFAVLDSKPKIKKHTGRKLKKFAKHIKFEHVIFNYPSRPDVKVLRGFNLKINCGETVALVGSSGCGKSTCIQLLQRFYDPLIGKIKIDDVNIRDVNLDSLRQKIAVVSQEPALFGTTVAENIRYGKLNATQQEIEEAAKKANAHKFIMNLPQGYQTLLGERGSQLSGGQKQRIAIARALVKEPEILLLDEATSALDTTSEAEVQAALDSISGTCTTIIVAHRLSTIRNANRIVVVSNGKVMEVGSHAELMEKQGEYYRLVTSQGFTDKNEEKEDKRLSRALSAGVTSICSESFDDIEDEDEEEEAKVKGVIGKILRMNRSDWIYICLGCLSSVVTGASLPVYGLVFGGIIGVLANENNEFVRKESNIFCIYFLILGIATGLATFLQMFTFAISGENLTLKIRSETFKAMLKQEIGWYDKKENRIGALCSQLAGDAAAVQGIAGVQIGTVLNFISTFILTCAFSFYYEWRITLVLLSMSPLIFFSIYFEQRMMNQDAVANQKMLEKSAKLAVEAISNIRTVVSLGCEKVFLDQYINELLPYLTTAKKKSHIRGVVQGMARSLMMFSYAAGIKYGADLIVKGEIDYGTVFTVNEVMIVGTWSVGNALSLSPNFQKGLVAASRIMYILERVPVVRNVVNPLKSLWNDESVEFSQVYFSYPTRPSASILNALDLSVLKGKTVALVGSSGCGKSTIIQLLERFYDPGYGEITINDDDIKITDLKVLRSQLGIVSQEPNLFDLTITENIAYGANYKNVDMHTIVEAAKAANIHKFISQLPLGYDTRIGSKGTQLSGGQKQRIAIARALVRNPKILLLDEATSALDNESEKIVQEALDNARKGRTCITIAHRLTTIQDADLICVLKEGFVAEMGTHKELLDKRGLYYKFYKLQSVQS